MALALKPTDNALMVGAADSQRPKLLLHIGAHKTGTTYFQTSLRGCAGLGMFNAWPKNDNGHPLQNMAAYAMDLVSGHWARNQHKIGLAVAQWIKNQEGDKVVSAEHFDSAAPDVVSHMAQLYSAYRVRVIFVYRNTISHAISRHAQLVAGEFETRSFFDWFDSMDEAYRPSSLMSVLGNFTVAFGRQNVRIVDFDGVLANPGLDLNDALMEQAGWAPLPDACHGIGHRNSETNMSTVMLAIEFRKFAAARGCPGRDPARQALGSLGKDLQRAHGLPQRCYDGSSLAHWANKSHHEFRQAYRDIWHYHNETATRLAMRSKFPLCFLDTNALWQDPEWLHRFHQYCEGT